MASKLIHCSRLFKNNFSPIQKFAVIARSSSVTTWNKDWKPGPYPKTEEERRLAAKKYNLIPEDYEPYPEEEGYGDYPKLQPVCAAARNQFETFDYLHIKRNFGEPLHVDFDLYVEDKLNLEEKYVYPLWGQFLYLAGFAGLIMGSIQFGKYYFTREIPVVPKQYPYQGQKHYTFEPADS